MAHDFEGASITDSDPVHSLYSLPHLYSEFYYALKKLLISKPPNSKETDEHPTGPEGKTTALAFSACTPGDGASTIALNFAFAFANNSAKTVILVDGNLRNPVLHHKFAVKRGGGLVDLLLEKATLQEVMTEVVPNAFYFIQAGQRTNHPVDLYESERFASLMEELRGKAYLIIFDSAPVLGSPETVLLARRMDGLVMVLRAGKTQLATARSAKEDLEGAQAHILGAVLNRQPPTTPSFIKKLL